MNMIFNFSDTDCRCLRTGCWGEYLDLRGESHLEMEKIAYGERYSSYCSPNIIKEIKENVMSGACSMHGSNDKYIQHFSLKTD
jgi:hypothetical protein